MEIVRLHLARIESLNGIPVHGFVIKHPRAGAILVDTGIGWGDDKLIREWRVVNRHMADALEEHHLSPADVKIVINSHLHFDHCGQNAVFKHAPFYMQRSELARARKEEPVNSQWFDFAGARFELLDGDTEIVDGVRVVATPGHTVGHQSVFVDIADGSAVMIGDAAYTSDIYRDVEKADLSRWPGQHADRESWEKSLMKVHSMHPHAVHFCHDTKVVPGQMAFGPLVDADWLHRHIDDRDVRVIDFRWYLHGRSGRDEFLRGHIPHSVFLNLERVTGTDGGGRHPLPSAAQFQHQMRLRGIDDNTKVVVYDDAGGSVAARLWFLLGYFGHRAQAVLNGGLQAWGQPLEDEVEVFGPGNFTAREPDRSRALDFDAVRNLHGMPLIDARAGERYRGEKEPIDPKAGHIPGALSAPFSENLDPDGRFKSPEELRSRYERLGAAEGAVFYCGSGVNATHHILAMEIAGLPDARLYAGSWSDWSSRDAPVATGDKP